MISRYFQYRIASLHVTSRRASGNEKLFSRKLFKMKIVYCIVTNMDALTRACKPRIENFRSPGQ